MLNEWLIATWNVIVASSPWLLFGFFFAGVMHVLLPAGFIKRQLQAPGIKSVLKASAFGIPLPLCSCSVIPVGISLRRQGASRGATASFFVSTPEIGVDSFLLSFFLLGPLLAVTRVVATLFSAIGVGIVIDKCTTVAASTLQQSEPKESCCASDVEQDKTVQSTSARLVDTTKRIFRFAYVDIFDDLAIVLSVGFLGAGLVSAIVPDDLFQSLGLSSFVSMLIMLLVALPVYVCATSSTPLVAVLLAKGLCPGAAIVFLLAGPATNITTILALSKELGKRGLAVYLAGIIGVSLFFGFLINIVMAGTTQFSDWEGMLDSGTHDHRFMIAGLLFSILLGVSLMKRIIKRLKA